jgi:dienelactone hydrolase
MEERRSFAVRIALCFPIAILSLHAQTIEVTPARVLIDEAAIVRVNGCRPNEHITIRAELTDGADFHWESQSEFVADAQGAIDTSKQAPIAGSYKEVSAMGPVWSMKPSRSKEGRYQPPRDFGVQTVEFHLMRGATAVAVAHLEQAVIADGVERLTLHDGSLRGLLFIPPGKSPHPGILVLGGSEGGMPARRAAWFASHGYAALALAYFRFDDLPRELAGIPLEYFGQGLLWMARRPEIDPNRIAVSGASRGGELALQLGSMYPGIKAVVAFVPANVRYPACCGFTSVPYAWTWQGRGLAFRPVGRAGLVLADFGSEIAVEQTHGPILVISGGEDGIWNSSSMTESIIARLKRKHFAYDMVRLNYPRAGHSAGRPEIVPSWQGWARNPTSGRDTEMGGIPAGNAESSLDAPPRILEFLAKSLSVQ